MGFFVILWLSNLFLKWAMESISFDYRVLKFHEIDLITIIFDYKASTLVIAEDVLVSLNNSTHAMLDTYDVEERNANTVKFH